MGPGRTLQSISERSLLLVCMATIASNSHAAENEPIESAPDLEFLEFLGQFETDAGEWIDPDSLLTEEFSGLLEASTEAETESNSTTDSSNDDDATNDTQ